MSKEISRSVPLTFHLPQTLLELHNMLHRIKEAFIYKRPDFDIFIYFLGESSVYKKTGISFCTYPICSPYTRIENIDTIWFFFDGENLFAEYKEDKYTEEQFQSVLKALVACAEAEQKKLKAARHV